MKGDSSSGSSILVVIGQVLVEPWLSITRDGQFPTWLQDAHQQGIRVRHSHGRRSNKVIQALDRGHEWLRWHGRGRSLVPRIDGFLGRPWLDRVPKVRTGEFLDAEAVAWQQTLVDVYALQRWKVIGSLTQSLTEDFTHVYFTTASSYVRVRQLVTAVEGLPTTGVYAGTPFTDAISGTRFASGANRILSRDVVEAIVREKKRYRNDVMEDAALGSLIQEMGIDLLPLESVNVPSIQSVEELSDETILESFHFRTTSQVLAERRDPEVMWALHARVIDLETQQGIRHAER